eukprot:GFUD01033367.1.p1 GENE.GFUD01033367.1~~GFUD01033367.1.p1  ORF type:complete len:117 (+),score=33.55 GFUD01033367.1:23-352(+)
MSKSELKIREISDATSSSAGGEKKILICDELDPSGLQLVFYDEQSGWTGFGEFSPSDIHHNSIFVFRTPAFAGIERETSVKLGVNKSDGSACSNTIQFTFYPQRVLDEQ